jgi:hypothetical protein
MKEFANAAELRAHYRDVQSRRPPPEPKPKQVARIEVPEPEPEPQPPLIPMLVFTPPIRRFAHIVSEYYGITITELRSPSHQAKLARPRQVFCYVCRSIAKQPYPRIGRVIRRDHSTVVHACRKIAELAETNSMLANDIAVITARYRETSAMRMRIMT